MKKVLSILLVSALLMSILSGCSIGRIAADLGSTISGALESDLPSEEDSSSEDSEISISSEDSEISESIEESSSSESEESGDVVQVNNDYMQWTQKDWENATDAQKEECVIAYLMYVAEKMGQAEHVTAEMFKSQVESMLPTLDTLFSSMGLTGLKTLQEATDFGLSLLEDNQ